MKAGSRGLLTRGPVAAAAGAGVAILLFATTFFSPPTSVVVVHGTRFKLRARAKSDDSTEFEDQVAKLLTERVTLPMGEICVGDPCQNFTVTFDYVDEFLDLVVYLLITSS